MKAVILICLLAQLPATTTGASEQGWVLQPGAPSPRRRPALLRRGVAGNAVVSVNAPSVSQAQLVVRVWTGLILLAEEQGRSYVSMPTIVHWQQGEKSELVVWPVDSPNRRRHLVWVVGNERQVVGLLSQAFRLLVQYERRKLEDRR